MNEVKYKPVECVRVSKGIDNDVHEWKFKEDGRANFYNGTASVDLALDIDRYYTKTELDTIFNDKRSADPLCFIPDVQESKRTYLTNAEAFSWGEFLHSDFRKLLKQREARAKLAAGMQDFTPWTFAMKNVTKEDMKLWKYLYFDKGIRNFNNIAPILEVWTYGNQ